MHTRGSLGKRGNIGLANVETPCRLSRRALRRPLPSHLDSRWRLVLSQWLVRRPVAHGGESDQCGEVPAVYNLYVREQRVRKLEKNTTAPFCLENTSQAEDFARPQRARD